MRYPKPQRGNPHKLTIDQHIFPKACIARFAGERGTVQVRRKDGEHDLWLTPGNSYFCARQAPGNSTTNAGSNCMFSGAPLRLM